MKSYRVVYSIRGYVDIEAGNPKDALEAFDSSKVKKILEKSSYEKIDVTEL